MKGRIHWLLCIIIPFICQIPIYQINDYLTSSELFDYTGLTQNNMITLLLLGNTALYVVILKLTKTLTLTTFIAGLIYFLTLSYMFRFTEVFLNSEKLAELTIHNIYNVKKYTLDYDNLMDLYSLGYFSIMTIAPSLVLSIIITNSLKIAGKINT